MKIQSMNPLLDLQEQVSNHLEEICKLFKQRPKITIVIRTPWLEAEGKDGGVVITDDDFDKAIAEINRLRDKPEIGASTPTDREDWTMTEDGWISRYELHLMKRANLTRKQARAVREAETLETIMKGYEHDPEGAAEEELSSWAD